MSTKRSAPKHATHTPTTDPTTDEALLALAPSFAEAPDIPVDVAQREIASLARLALSQQARFAKVGIGKDKIETIAGFARRLGALERAWQKARGAVKMTAAQKKLRAEAEALDLKLVAGGRWACRKDTAALEELARIAEGSDLADTIQDLRDLAAFWAEREAERGVTDITAADLKRATTLADSLDSAAENESADVDAARALGLRNRCFWAADELAKDIREGGRYAFKDEPKVAAKFVSRYRVSLNRKSRKKAKAQKGQKAPSAGSGDE